MGSACSAQVKPAKPSEQVCEQVRCLSLSRLPQTPHRMKTKSEHNLACVSGVFVLRRVGLVICKTLQHAVQGGFRNWGTLSGVSIIRETYYLGIYIYIRDPLSS